MNISYIWNIESLMCKSKTCYLNFIIMIVNLFVILMFFLLSFLSVFFYQLCGLTGSLISNRSTLLIYLNG